MSTDARVRAQYQALPYPARDPRDEAKRLIVGSPSHLAEVDHYLFAGGRVLGRPFRVLVAGGGTGDATVMLAQQLADAGRAADIVHLEPSATARAIAADRLARRALTSVSFVDDEIEALPGLGLGVFDYIDCCGVLHHLADPLVGLRALVSVLAPGGGLGIMVYGRLGRSGLYDLQAALATLVPDGTPADRIAAARRVVQALPPHHPFRLNRQLGDHLTSDAGLYDLLLHPRDRAYDVAELLALLRDAGVSATGFVEPLRYDPAAWVSHPDVRRRFAGLDQPQRWALAEQLSAAMPRHVVYAGRPGEVAAATVGPDLVPRWRDGAPAPDLIRALNSGQLTVDDGVVALSQPMPRGAGAVAERIDGTRDLRAIISDLSVRDADAVATETLERLIAANLVLLQCRADACTPPRDRVL
jgi:SAM-dependent methyltransferase